MCLVEILARRQDIGIPTTKIVLQINTESSTREDSFATESCFLIVQATIEVLLGHLVTIVR